MNAVVIVVIALLVFALAYRYYSAFIAAKILVLDDNRPTPAVTMSSAAVRAHWMKRSARWRPSATRARPATSASTSWRC